MSTRNCHNYSEIMADRVADTCNLTMPSKNSLISRWPETSTLQMVRGLIRLMYHWSENSNYSSSIAKKEGTKSNKDITKQVLIIHVNLHVKKHSSISKALDSSIRWKQSMELIAVKYGRNTTGRASRKKGLVEVSCIRWTDIISQKLKKKWLAVEGSILD